MRGRRNLTVAIWAGILATCLGLLGFTGWMTWQSRERALESAADHTRNTTRMLERHAASILETAELIIYGAAKELAAHPGDAAAREHASSFLDGVTGRRRRSGALAAIRSVHVVEPTTGAVVFASDEAAGLSAQPRTVAAVDAEAVKAHAGADSLGLYVGTPLVDAPGAAGRPDGGAGPADAADRWFVGLSRRVSGRDGRLGPIVVVHLSLDDLQDLYDGVGELGDHGSVQLLRSDGRLLVRRPYQRDSVGRDLSRSPLFQEHLGRTLQGTYTNRGVIDGVERIVSYRRLAGAPLLLAVAVAKHEVLASWRSSALRDAGLAGAASFGIVVLGAWLSREMRRRARIEDELSAQAQVLRSTLENMGQGLVMVDAHDIVRVCNGRAAEYLDLSPELMAQRPRFAGVLAEQIAAGEFGPAEMALLQRPDADRLWRGRHVYERTRPNGTVLEVRTTPLEDGGVVRTFTDVTVHRTMEAELREQNRRFDAALNTMGQGLLMVDANLIVTVANRRVLDLYGLSPDIARPGVHAQDVVLHSMERGNYPDAYPPAAAWANWEGILKVREARTFRHLLPDGRKIAVVCTPAADGGWVITYEDVTQRLAAEDALQAQNLLFDAALANMAQGLCMFDAQGRLVVRNDRYLALFGNGPSALPLGTPYRTIIEEHIRAGRYAPGVTPDDVCESTRLRLAGGDGSPIHRTLSDGRVIAVSHRAMRSGGWVATFDDITERQQAEARIAYMARHDALTGLPNRFDLRDRMEAALARLQVAERFAVLCLDLDRFKAVNDTLGHGVGDTLLKDVARRIRACVGVGSCVARLGGDEFAVLQTDTDPDAPARLARRLGEALGAPFVVEGHEVVIGASIGIAVAPADGDSSEQLLRNADMALYRAKADGRGGFRAFELAMDVSAQTRRALELELRQALARDEFELHYQPLVSLAAGEPRVSCFEALLRWRHPERGMVAPADFIPLAEEIGLIIPLGEWVLRQACKDAAAAWPDDVRVAVNLSAVQFRRGEDLAQKVFGALAATGLRAGRLELEITETVLLEDTEATLATLHRLRSFGVRIALDDFGTGYSSLSYLRKFPFDKIKIDRSFVREILGPDNRAAPGGADPGDRPEPAASNAAAIVHAIATLGASLGMTTTAEGIETVAQLDAVRAKGCTEVQGYLFSRPLQLADATAFLSGDMRRAAA